eukprot:6188168-Pleurochrysis_carterae.AAC.2
MSSCRGNGRACVGGGRTRWPTQPCRAACRRRRRARAPRASRGSCLPPRARTHARTQVQRHARAQIQRHRDA